MRYKKSHIVYSLLLLACTAFIWIHSMQDGETSGELSRGVLAWLIDTFNLPITEHTLRKIAHGCEYTLEGFLLCNALWRGFSLNARNERPAFARAVPLTLLVGILVSLVDETIQIFSEGRTTLVTDVWIDAGGILAGIIVAGIIKLLMRRGRAGHSRKYTRYTKPANGSK